MKKKGVQRDDPNYWEWRKNVGSPKALKSPAMLWQLACEYFKLIDSRPFKKQEQRKGIVKLERGMKLDPETLASLKSPVIEIDTIRPYTWAGFESYLIECSVIVRLEDYKSNKEGRYAEFAEVVRAIDRTMFAQKFEGAAVGAFNANIIARDLGLAEKTQIKIEEQPLFGDEDLS